MEQIHWEETCTLVTEIHWRSYNRHITAEVQFIDDNFQNLFPECARVSYKVSNTAATASQCFPLKFPEIGAKVALDAGLTPEHRLDASMSRSK